MDETRETREYLENELGHEKLRAVYLLLDMEMADGTIPDAPKNHEDVARILGITRQTLYNWRKKDPHFIKYKNLVAKDFFAENDHLFYQGVLKSIKGTQPSVKALDIYAKARGLYDNKVTINNEYTSTKSESTDDIEKSLKSLQKIQAQLLAEGNEEAK